MSECVRTSMCFVEVALQAAQVGGFKGAELALKGLAVSVVRLHVSVQTEGRKQTTKKGLQYKEYFIVTANHFSKEMAKKLK